MELKEKKQDLTTDSADLEEAINLTGYGRFHYKLLAISAFSLISVGFQNGLSGYVFPAAQCELDLSSSQIGLLNVLFMVGGALSSFLWGVLADIVGRRKILLTAHLANALFTVIFIILKPILLLEICRFVNGFLIGAPGSILFTYLAEFQPKKHRSSVICYCGLFFTSTWLLLPLIAWIILPINLNFEHFFIKISSWRVFFIILALLEIIVGFFFVSLPESPKFLAAKGRNFESLEVLKQIFRENQGTLAGDYPVKKLINGIEFDEKRVVQGRASRNLSLVWRQFRSLFKAPLLFGTLLTCSIMFTNMVGAFGLGLWLPELFIRFQQFQDLHPNNTITVSELSKLPRVRNTTSCVFSLDPSVIKSTAAMGFTSLVTNFLSGFFVNSFNLRTIPTLTMLLGGLSALSIYWLRTPMQNLIVASIFQATMVTANMNIGNVAIELFPTSVAALAISLIMFTGRIGAIMSNFFFGYFIDEQCEIPIFIVAINVLLGSVFCFFIPKRKAKDDRIKNIEISTISNTV